MRALSIYPEWAWLIIAGHKKIENRTWAPPPGIVGGRILIHASARRPSPSLAAWILETYGIHVPPEELSPGAILGSVIVDAVTPYEETRSRWAMGPICWHLRDPQPLDSPVPAKGQTRLWTPPPGLL